MVEIELDGKKVEVAEGSMVMHAAFGHFDLLAVEFDFDHVRFSLPLRPGPASSARSRAPWPRTR
ncbi:hypothetical protein, partial [uncultured Variovorax sp.]|uniref:hypothetical protein n=1 Tax=uncultured Variovorax sp. TaxID=114708 RepID=UPI0025D3ED50